MSKLFSHQMIGGLGAASVDTDEYFENTTLLLKGDGNQGATNFSNAGPPTYLAFKDNSSNNFPITVNGDAYGDNFGPFATADGYWSNSFDGSGDYIQAGSNAALAPGSGDFTIECWIYPTNNNFYNGIYQNYTDGLSRSTALRINTNNADQTSLMVQTAATALITTSTGVVTANAWNHIALVRNGSGSNNLVLYVNGVSVGSATNTTNFSDGYAQIGNSVYNGTNYYWNGGISNLRVVPGIAVYTGNFSVPTSPLSTTQSSDTNIAAITGTSTSLLTCQSNRFVDNSTNNFTITPAGNVATKVFNPFTELPSGYWSNSFNGTTSIQDGILSVADDTSLVLTSTAFTIEAWVNMTYNTTSYTNWIVGKRSTNGVTGYAVAYVLGIDATGYPAFWDYTTTVTSSTTISLNTWNHIVATHDGTYVRLYLNGSLVAGPTAFTVTDTSASITIGNYSVDTPEFNGYISNVKIVKGYANAPSGVPTTPATKTTGTSLLTCQDGAFLDRSDNAHTITVSGTVSASRTSPFTKPAVPTAALPDGVNGSGYFDGTGDYLEVPDDDTWAFGTNDFTIEAWVYPTSTPTQYIIDQWGAAGTQRAWYMALVGTEPRAAFYNTSGSALFLYNTNYDIRPNEWTHLAIVRSGNNFSWYVNGQVSYTDTSTTNFDVRNFANRVLIGMNDDGDQNLFNGFISGVRVVNGTAIDYSTNPPTSPPTAVTNTSLLTCQYAGTVRNVGFIDSSPYDHVITRVNNATQGSFSPFSKPDGRWGNSFNTSTTYLTTPADSNIQAGTGNITVEAWLYVNALPSVYASILSVGPLTAGNWQLELLSTGKIRWETYSAVYLDQTDFPLNEWFHVAVVRSGTGTDELKLYLNGVNVESATCSESLSPSLGSTNVAVGASMYSLGTNRYLDGYISNLRYKKSAVYTSDFTPSTTPLDSDADTVLLTCQSNRFVDNGNYTYALTATGTPKVTPFSPFPITTAYDPSVNGGSGYFDGSGDNLTITSGVSTQFDPSAGFTLECWVYITNTTATQYVFEVRGSTADWNASTGIAFQLIPYHAGTSPRTCKWQFKNGSPTSISGSPAIEFAWNHVCVGYDGTTTRVWMNGTSIGSSTAAYSPPTVSNVSIGNNVSGTVPLGGYLSGLRFVQGVDIYGVGNTTIAVPTAPFTSISGTSLLCNFTNAGILDYTGSNNLETVGNAQVDTNTVKYGPGSMKFDGTGDYLTTGVTPTWANFGTSDLTIECWVLFNSVASTQMFVSSNYNASTGAGGWTFGYRADNTTLIFSVNANVQYGKTWSPSIDTWYHVAVSRSGTNLRLFVDGTQIGTTSTSSDNISGATDVWVGSNFSTPFALNGYIDDLRITNGVARYTDTFTPPTKTLPIVGV